MRITAIIAEYNPFHKGHQFHIEETRRITGCDHIIVVMSGDFTQRGIPAIMPKHERAAIALSCGADLVLELPANYATGTAERFAYGAVTLLDSLHCVNTLSFGSESGDLSGLRAVADFLCAPTQEFEALIGRKIADGHCYPRARQEALASLLDEAVLLSDSNNILAVEYLKALTRQGSSITPVTIKRSGSSYSDGSLTEGQFPSAMALRGALLDRAEQKPGLHSRPHGRSALDRTAPLGFLASHLPFHALSRMEETYGSTWPVFIDDFSAMLHYKLLDGQAFEQYQDTDEDLSDRVQRLGESFSTVSAFTEMLKTKNVTYSRVSRALLHILLSMTERPATPCPYARVLGFKKESTGLLSVIKQHSGVPLITKVADAPSVLSDAGFSMLQEDIHASHIYHAAVTQKYGTRLSNEYRTMIPIC